MAISSCSMTNAHYDKRCFLPIHVYDAGTGRCILTVLRPGKTPDGKEGVPIYVDWWGASGCIGQTPSSPSVATVITADVKRWIGASKNGVHYIFGLSTNAVLARCRSSPRPMTSASGARLPTSTWCATTPRLAMAPNPGRIPAASWRGLSNAGKVSMSATSLPTSPTGTAAWLYDSLYCARGTGGEPD